MGRDWSDMVGVGRILAAAGGSARARDERKESLRLCLLHVQCSSMQWHRRDNRKMFHQN